MDKNVDEKPTLLSYNVHIICKDENGKIKTERFIHNSIQDLGNAHIAAVMSGGASAMSHLAVGTSNANDGDTTQTALGTEIDRHALDSTTQGVGANDNKVTYIATFAAGHGTGDIVEAGIFNDAVAGVMLCRSVFTVIPKGALDTLVINWTLTFGTT